MSIKQLMGLSFALILGLLPACDGAESSLDGADTEADHGVTVQAVDSEYSTCGTYSYASLTFTIANDGDEAITPKAVLLAVPSGEMLRGFVAPSPLAPGASAEYQCFNGFVGEVSNTTEVSRLTLDFQVSDALAHVEVSGTHVSSQAFDFCDTAFPQREIVDCVRL